MTGDVYVSFLTNDTNNTFVVAHFGSPTGLGNVEGHSSFDWGAVGDQDIEKMLGGSFKVVLNALRRPISARKARKPSSS